MPIDPILNQYEKINAAWKNRSICSVKCSREKAQQYKLPEIQKEGTTTTPYPTYILREMKSGTWYNNETKALGIICERVSQEYRSTIEGSTCVKELWQQLKKVAMSNLSGQKLFLK